MFGITDRKITLDVSMLMTKIGLVMIESHKQTGDPELTSAEYFSAGMRYLMNNSRLFPSPKGTATKGRLTIFNKELYVAFRIQEMPHFEQIELVTYLNLPKDLFPHVIVPEVAADESTAEGIRIFQQALRTGQN